MESFDTMEMEFHANAVNGAVTDVENLLKLQKCTAVYADLKKWTYTCLEDEVCCSTGCCVNEYMKMTQFWYAWFMLTIFIAFLLGCFHYYKKQRVRELRMRELAYSRARAQQQEQLDERERPLRQRMRGLHADDLPAEGHYVNFLRQYLGPFGGLEDADGDVEDPRLRWTPRGGDYREQLDQLFARVHEPRGARRLSPPVGALPPATAPPPPPAPPPSYDVLMRVKDEEPPPVYLEACRLIAHDGDAESVASGRSIAGCDVAICVEDDGSCIIDNVDCHHQGSLVA